MCSPQFTYTSSTLMSVPLPPAILMTRRKFLKPENQDLAMKPDFLNKQAKNLISEHLVLNYQSLLMKMQQLGSKNVRVSLNQLALHLKIKLNGLMLISEEKPKLG
jgi:hypothetical protein